MSCSIFIRILCPLVIVLSSCGGTSEKMNLDNFKSWLRQEDCPLRKSKKISGYKFSVSYLPPEYLVTNDMKKSRMKPSEMEIDNMVRKQEKSLTFILEVNHDETNSFDAITGRLSSKEEFLERAEKLNFQMQEDIELTVGDSVKYNPVLTHLENTYEIEKSRKIIVVFFIPDLNKYKDSSDFDFSWNDTVYHTGIHHFIITSNDRKSSPVITY